MNEIKLNYIKKQGIENEKKKTQTTTQRCIRTKQSKKIIKITIHYFKCLNVNCVFMKQILKNAYNIQINKKKKIFSK